MKERRMKLENEIYLKEYVNGVGMID